VTVAILAVAASNIAIASGWAPFSSEDRATVTRGGTVSVLDGGALSVLVNDWDVEGDEMTAILTKEPKHGDVVLEDDGTFSYQNDGHRHRDDEFRYRAFDGTGYSRDTRVRIRIEELPNNPPFTTGNPGDQEAVEGARFSLALAGYFGDLDEDDSLSFSANGLPGGLNIDRDSAVLSGTPRASDARDAPYNITIIATDPGGLSASLNFGLRVFPDDRADLKVTASIAVNPVTVGETAQWSIEVENLGPANVDQGELIADWITSGANLSLTAPQGCSLTGNNSRNPTIRCSLDGLTARTTSTFNVQGTQSVDGDYSLIAVVQADDPVVGNNAAVEGAQVVAAFSEGPAQILNEAAGGLRSADLDGDGLNDVVATTTSKTVVFFNSGNRTLATPGQSLGSNSGGNDVEILDWNGDGIPDIAVARSSGPAARIYLNDGSGGVERTHDIKYSGVGSALAAGSADFDRDGDEDLVLTGTGGSVLLMSSGGSGFSSTSLAAGPGIDVAVADLNNDTYADIIIVESGNRSVRLLRNTGNGRDYNSQRLQRGSVAGVSAADLDGDGDVDLMLAIDGDDLEAPESKVLVQRSDGSFPAGDSIGASPLSKLVAGDVDGDSVVDIVAVNYAGVHQVYKGKPGGGFELNAEQIISDGMRRGVLVDFNNDQSLDLILTGRDAGVFEIHANNGIGRLGLGDRVAPTVTLVGLPSVTIGAGGEYIEEGASAMDDIDGDVTASLTISGNVNTAVVGTYTVNYFAVDRAGNQGATVRTVEVGVNKGVGGGGGGMMSPALLLLLSLFCATLTHRRRGSLKYLA